MIEKVTSWARIKAPRWAVLTAAVLGLLAGGVLAHLEARWPHWHVDFGDTPTWTQGIAAIVAGVYAVRAFRVQRKQIEDLALNQGASDLMLRYQAYMASSAFAQHVKFDWHIRQLPEKGAVTMPTAEIYGVVGNESSGAMRNVAVRVRLDSVELSPVRMCWRERDENRQFPLMVSVDHWYQKTDFVEADSARAAVLLTDKGLEWSVWELGEISADRVDVEARFTDPIGTRWQYNSDRTLIFAPDTDW